MHKEQTSSATQSGRSAFRRSGVVFAIAAGAFIAGTIIGNGGPAQAFNPPDESKPDVLIKERVAPPVVMLEKGSVAIIGASDNRYYIVQQDGTLAILTGLNKEDLCWRRHDER